SPYDAANITSTTSDGRAPIVQDFYQTGAGTPAFSAASAGYATTPGGDNFLKTNRNTSGTYCTNAADALNISNPTTSTRDNTFETSGYAAYGMAPTTVGYTVGPGYWGKTFFVWPPDPTNDWRKLYFYYSGGTVAMDDNSKLWNSSGSWQAPSGTGYK